MKWDALNWTQRAAYARARATWHARTQLGVTFDICGEIDLAGNRCERPAGYNTEHEGWGACALHRGRRLRGRLEAAWIMGHELAKQLDITPWQGLLHAVKRAAGEAAWYDKKISEAMDDNDLRPGGDAWHWVEGSRQALDKLAKYSKMAIDAGVAQALVREVEMESRIVATAVARALDALDLTPQQRTAALNAARHELLSIDSGDQNVVDAEVT